MLDGIVELVAVIAVSGREEECVERDDADAVSDAVRAVAISLRARQ